MCYVLAFFRDEWCCRVLELSCCLPCLNQECVGGYLRTKYCRTSCHIFELVAWSWAVVEWLSLVSTEAKRSLLMLPVHLCLDACFVLSVRIEDQISICHHRTFSFLTFQVFGCKFVFSGKVKCRPVPCLIPLDTTAALNNALPWITAVSLKLINLAVTQIWRRISPYRGLRVHKRAYKKASRTCGMPRK